MLLRPPIYTRTNTLFPSTTPFRFSNNFSHAHFMLGGRAYPLDHEKKPAMLLLNNLLGGPSMSSRLNLTVREKHGICYTIESAYAPMSDTGIFSVYFGTEREKVAKCLQLIHRELRQTREQALEIGRAHV